MTIYAGQVEWGTAGEWVSGLGTAGALLVALLLYIGDRHRRQREQASKVSAWSKVVEDVTDERHVTAEPYGEGGPIIGVQARVTYRNGSESPVFRLAIFLDVDWLKKRPSTGYSQLIDPVEPGEQRTITLPLDRDPAEQYMVIRLGTPTVDLVFTDTEGRSWHWREGRLTAIRENPVEGTC